MKPILSAFILSSALIVPASWGQSTESPAPVRLHDLVDGVSFAKRERLLVRDIRIGSVSVKHLFHDLADEDVTTRAYYQGQVAPVIIRIKDERSLADLRALFRPHGQAAFILVDLKDPRKSLLRSLYENTKDIWRGVDIWPDVEFSRTVMIPIFDPCNRVTKIIYNRIDSIIRSAAEGQTEKEVSLSTIFDSLLADKEDLLLAGLDPIDKNNSCATTVELLKWLDNKGAQGFKSEEYQVNSEIKTVLASLADSLASVQNWKRNHIKVKVVGYTDPTPVGKISLSGGKTGVRSLEKTPLSVFFGGCLGDHLLGKGPQFFALNAREGQSVRSPLESNCELGAVRAYVTTTLMANALRGKDVEYEYATGGVSSLDTKNDAEKRRIDISITVKAAREDHQ